MKGSESGTSGIIANQGDILFFADSGTFLQMDTTPIVELKQQIGGVSEIKLNEKVTFSNQFTFPTTDGIAGAYLRTDGAGNVDWANTGSIVDKGMTGHLLDSLDSGNINTRILNTGNTIQDISGRVVYASTTGTIASPKLLDINNSGDLAAQFGDNINKITGLLDVNTGVGGNPQGTYGSEGQSLVVNQHENGVVWSGVTAGGSTTTFLNLTDTSNLANYSTVNQQLLAVSGSKIGFTGSGHFLDTTNSGHLNTRFITT